MRFFARLLPPVEMRLLEHLRGVCGSERNTNKKKGEGHKSPMILGVDSHSFQPSFIVFKTSCFSFGGLMVFWKEGTLETMEVSPRMICISHASAGPNVHCALQNHSSSNGKGPLPVYL